jgi:hypothetical protein
MPAEPIACPVAVGEPSKREIVEAVRVWLTTAIKPATHGHDKFQVAVAINALGILERELGTPSNAADKGLSEAILSGERTLHEPFLLARLRRAILAKCCVDSPKYPALAVAASQWAAATD